MARKVQDEVRKNYGLGPAYHMTHVDNLERILLAKGIKSKNSLGEVPHVDISNPDVQEGRAGIKIQLSGRPLHDYVPFYFGFKTPMVACNQDINNELIFLRVNLDILERPGTLFTDGNARSEKTKFFEFRSAKDLVVLDAKAINSVKYSGDTELKRRKQAEILVPDFLPIDEVFEIICFSNETGKRVLEKLQKHAIRIAISVNSGWYFKK